MSGSNQVVDTSGNKENVSLECKIIDLSTNEKSNYEIKTIEVCAKVSVTIWNDFHHTSLLYHIGDEHDRNNFTNPINSNNKLTNMLENSFYNGDSLICLLILQKVMYTCLYEWSLSYNVCQFTQNT